MNTTEKTFDCLEVSNVQVFPFKEGPMMGHMKALATIVLNDQIQIRGLRVMDAAAFALCEEHRIPILVLDFFAEGALEAAVAGGKVGTLVDGSEPPPVFG